MALPISPASSAFNAFKACGRFNRITPTLPLVST
jgi:hypothetical protein